MSKTTSKTAAVKSEVPRAGLTFQPAARLSETPITNDDASESKATFSACRTLLDITNEFLEKQIQDEKDNGENSCLADAENVFRFICTNHKTFCLNDVLAATRHLDSDAQTLIPVFNLWVKALKENGRLKSSAAIYDWQQHTFC